MKLLLYGITFMSLSAFSHPVIYKGGWVFQQSSMPQMSESKVGYTFHPKFSVMAKSQRFDQNNEYEDTTLGINVLAKRWLSFDSQANIYLGANIGNYEDADGSGQASHAMFMADWEDREDYLVFKSKKYFYDGDESEDYLLRYGFAPYVSGMDELQAWGIIQAYYYDQHSKEAVITPMLRFFYKNVLWEMGSSTNGASFLTLMVHY